MKLRIFRTSGLKVEGPMITSEIVKLKRPIYEDLQEIELFYCDIPDLEHFLKLPEIFWDLKYNKPAEIILTKDPLTDQQALEIYDTWRE